MQAYGAPAPRASVTSGAVRRQKSIGRSEARDDPVPPDVLERCRAGDERAWGELVEATHRQVYTLCLRILADPDDAAEATQDAYLRAWRGLAGFRGDAQVTTWLYRIATNAALSKHRSRGRRRAHETRVEDEVLTTVATAETTESVADARMGAGALEEALARLPEHYRVAVVLRDVYGLSIEEIASRTKVSETAAKVRVHRGRKRLRDAVFGSEEAGR